jgi:hypothetical protein
VILELGGHGAQQAGLRHTVEEFDDPAVNGIVQAQKGLASPQFCSRLLTKPDQVNEFEFDVG